MRIYSDYIGFIKSIQLSTTARLPKLPELPKLPKLPHRCCCFVIIINLQTPTSCQKKGDLEKDGCQDFLSESEMSNVEIQIVEMKM
jgi:hypothetical protein